MKKILLLGFATCAIAIAPALSASAMPITPSTAIGSTAIGASNDQFVQVKGGHGHGRGHMGRGNRGRHLGWTRGRHRG